MLKSSDISEMISLLRLLEKVSDRKSFFELFFRGLENLIHISSGVFIPYDRVQQSFRIEGNYVFNHDESIFMDYVAHYNPMDAFISTGWFKSNGPLVAVREDLVPSSILYESEFMVDFLSKIPAKYDMGLRLVVEGDFMGGIGLHRKKEKGNFQDRERKIVEILGTPLTEIFHQQEFLNGPDLFSNPDIGIIVADSSGAMLYSNPLAQRAVEGHSPISFLSLAKGMAPVFLRSRGCVYRIRSFRLTSPSSHFLENRIAGKEVGKPGHCIRVVLFEPVSATLSVKQKLESSDLTLRQRTVVEKVIQGWTNREIAEDFGISEQTVKDHLHDIFERLRIRNRIELTTFFMDQPVMPLEQRKSP